MKKKYGSAIAEAIEAGGDFINSVKNPWFVLVLMFMLGGGFILYKATFLICGSIDNLSTKMEQLNQRDYEQTVLLKSIDDSLKKVKYYK